ncbi:chalcone isomerase-like protein 1 [Ziziphus jujuba]|uniref:Chalcone isomerase-like protein 1 n=1 Tax=Ziziphus jujuba TaxID=326968 RepID=A0A6P3ZZV3_ZIZJJ|nr:chalcone isomerase-like protein 1 [Ziziphus jujuba]
MATTVEVEGVITKAEKVTLKPQNPEEGNGIQSKEEMAKDSVKNENQAKLAQEPDNDQKPQQEEEVKTEEVGVEVESKTGVSFPVKLDDGKLLNCVGLRKKSMLGMGIKIYAFGIYADNEKLKDLLKLKIAKPPAKPTKEMYDLVIDSDLGMVVKLVIVFSGLTMSMVKKNFDEGLGASIKKLNGGKKNDELASKVMGQASDNIKLTSGSVIEISKLPGYVLQTKVMGEVVSKVENELLCRAYIHLYLGDDPFDKDAKEKFGMSLLSLF